jgi:hypothetical protein
VLVQLVVVWPGCLRGQTRLWSAFEELVVALHGLANVGKIGLWRGGRLGDCLDSDMRDLWYWLAFLYFLFLHFQYDRDRLGAV